jgi:hypothetical protein
MEVAIRTPNAVKKDIMKKPILSHKLQPCSERAELDIEGLVKRYGGKMRFKNDVQQYIRDLKATVEVLMKS